MSKRAAIYVRTSSEHQAEKSSPDEQEADCRRLAQEQSLAVVGVYRDIERYRVKGKLVDPSGTRADRPGLQALLRDARAGLFDVILAWREDRLYRGLKAMLVVLDLIQEHRVSVLLAKESFDAKFAPIKAWVAGMELDAMKERMTMGVKARLRAGRANTGQDRYGYQRNGDVIEIVEEEAHWVRQVFDWYLEGVAIKEIRRRLIEAGAPQKGSSRPRKIRWAVSSVQAILKGAKDYANGIKVQTRAGERFEIACAPIISAETCERYLKQRKVNRRYPAHNVRHDYLLRGLIQCPCGSRWTVVPLNTVRYNRGGQLVPRKTSVCYYKCNQVHADHRHADCPRTIGARKADEGVWDVICRLLDKPELLIDGARQHVEYLRTGAEEAQRDLDRILRDLERVKQERQWVITEARRDLITEDDMAMQLTALSLQETGLRRELSAASNAEPLQLDNWEEAVRAYLEDVRAGLTALAQEPQSEEARAEHYELKRRVVKTLVERVDMGRDRAMNVAIHLDIVETLKAYNHVRAKADSNVANVPEVGICSRRSDIKKILRVLVVL